MDKSVMHGKVTKRWCDECGTLILGKKCSICLSDGREFEINSPGDIRPCMGTGEALIQNIFKEHFGTSGPIDSRLLFLNKIAGDDRADEIIAHGTVIAAMRFNILTKEYDLELRQAGAEIFSEHAAKNVITFGNMSGHLKGKSVPGSNIIHIKGEFGSNEPVILRKGGKVGPGVSLGESSQLREAEKAVRIKDMFSPSGIPLSPVSDRKTFVNANEYYLKNLESAAASDIRSFVKGKGQPLTVSFSGGKDSLAALGVAMRVVESPELMFVNTGIEFPETVEYVRRFAKKKGLRLHEAYAGNAFWENVETFGPPAKDFRWCCKVCKLGPITETISEKYPKGTITVEGNRALESFSRSRTGFVSKNPFVPNQTTLNPIRGWSAAEVWGYIWMKGMEYNPLYDHDFERIGCYLCASCLSSEWDRTKHVHPELHEEWEDFLESYRISKGLPKEYASMGLWRWKVLPPKMLKLTEGMDLRTRPDASEISLKMLKGASPCAAGGHSMEAIVSIPRRRDFSAIEDSLRTMGDVRYSDEFEIALLKCKEGTVKMFGGGQVSIRSNDPRSAERLFERSVKALLRSQMCTECGICVKSCRRKAIRIKDGFTVDPERCISCGSCERSCMVMHYYDKMMT